MTENGFMLSALSSRGAAVVLAKACPDEGDGAGAGAGDRVANEQATAHLTLSSWPSHLLSRGEPCS